MATASAVGQELWYRLQKCADTTQVLPESMNLYQGRWALTEMQQPDEKECLYNVDSTGEVWIPRGMHRIFLPGKHQAFREQDHVFRSTHAQSPTWPGTAG